MNECTLLFSGFSNLENLENLVFYIRLKTEQMFVCRSVTAQTRNQGRLTEKKRKKRKKERKKEKRK